jgi:tRNA threonylcarbamoyladenosine biosynthesis protein TsaB
VTAAIADPVLALETSAGACAVCLWKDGAVLAGEAESMTHGHAEALAPMTDRVMRAAGVPFAALGAVAVTVGPGSFTGLRVGLAFARGLGLAVGCPVLGATTLAVLAAMHRGPTPLAVVLDARRAEVFVQVFGAGGSAPLAEAVSVPPGDVAALLPAGPGRLAGDGARLVPDPLPAGWTRAPAGERTPDPAALAALVAADPGAALAPHPLYIRPPDAALPPPNARARA